LQRALPGWVPEARFLDEADSTNRTAIQWAADGGREGCLVVADYQTAGRGRFGRDWFGPKGECLLFSLILRPDCDPAELGLINLGAAVALCRALPEETPARIKWPNDVMINGRKTAGILSEVADFSKSSPMGSDLTPQIGAGDAGGRGRATSGRVVVLGVGLNVNVERFGGEISGTATSLMRESGRSFDRLEILAEFLEGFGDIYSAFPDGIVPAYLELCETVGKSVRVHLSNGLLEDMALGVDSQGRLLLQSGQAVEAGDVIHLR